MQLPAILQGDSLKRLLQGAVDALRRSGCSTADITVVRVPGAFEIPSQGLIKQANEALKNSIVKRHKPDLHARINDLAVLLYLVDDMSLNDPYVIIESTESESSVVIIINLAHPHWSQLTNKQSIENFVRHCVYDGVSEWKAYLKTKKIDPDTVKLIKDNLLRIPFNLGNT